MKLTRLHPFIHCRAIALILGLAVLGNLSRAAAQTYRIGDVVQDFTLVNRATGQPMKLSDFEGRIVFLDWFAWWCPFCQAAAPQLLEGIDNYYMARNGNPAGIPVVHVGVNLQRGQEAQTENFVNRAQLEIVLEDFARSVASRFASGGQPIFAIINGVAGSPGHPQWELLFSQLGYGQTKFPVEVFRAAIDSVQKAAVTPVTIVDPPWNHTIAAGSSITLEVTATGTLPIAYQWQKDGRPISGATSASLTFADVEPSDAGSYQVVVSNAAGGVPSAAAVITVLEPDIPPRLTGLRTAADGAFEFEFSGTPGRSYRIETSSDLSHWSPVTTVDGTSALQLVRDPAASNSRIRYYRVRSE